MVNCRIIEEVKIRIVKRFPSAFRHHPSALFMKQVPVPHVFTFHIQLLRSFEATPYLKLFLIVFFHSDYMLLSHLSL